MDSLSMVEIAAKQRHVLLLKKVRNNQPLSAGELRELKDYEESMGKKQSKKSISKAAKRPPAKKNAKQAGRITAVQVKTWALKYETMGDCETGEGLGFSLAAALNRSQSFKAAWKRGQFLRHLRAYGGDTNLTLTEVEIEMQLPSGELELLFETDTEAAEVFNNARRSTRIGILKIYIDQARAGELTPSMARQMAEMLKREIARTKIDFDRVPTAQMCDLFGVSRITILNWQKDYGAPCNADRKSYNLKAFIDWYGDFQIQKINTQPGKYLTGGLDESERLRNRKIQMQLDEFEKRLVPADRAMGSLLFRAAALDKFIAANGANLYLKLAGLKEEQIKEKLDEYHVGLRQASCCLPGQLAELLPESTAEKFAEILKQLSTETKG